MRSSNLRYIVLVVMIVTDLLLVDAVFWMAFYIVDQFNSLSDNQYRNYLLVFNLLWLFSANLFQMYSEENTKSSELIYRTTWRSVLAQILFFFLYLFLTKDTLFSRHFLALLYLLLILSFFLSRFLGTVLEYMFKERLSIKKSVAILGKSKTAIQLANFFQAPGSEYKFEGYLNESSELFSEQEQLLPEVILPEIGNAINEAVRRNVSEIYVPMAVEQIFDARHLLKEAERQCIRLKFIPEFSEHSSSAFLNIDYLGEFPVISLRKEPLEDTQSRFRKRVFDVGFSVFVIVFILSWLYPIVALLIKLQSKGPVLFKQERSGRDNKPFVCYKFRSMKLNPHSDTLQATESDTRITAVGRFLRKSSLDELPQFFNVLKGDMSVVGPRPHMLKHTQEYSEIIDSFMIRQFMKPGITGWAQVNGYRGQTTSPVQMSNRVAFDIWYMENWSLMLDVKIIFLTIFLLVKGDKNAF